MKYKISYSTRFKKHFKKLQEIERKQVKKKIDLLSQNPYHLSLRTKRIQGTEDLFECSVNMDIRIFWFYQGDTIIMLLDIGHHNILKRK